MAETEHETSDPRTGWTRVAIGFFQGVAFWLLLDEKLAALHRQHPAVTSALIMGVLAGPMILLAGLGRMRSRILGLWAGGAALTVAGLALYGHWRNPFAEVSDRVATTPDGYVVGFGALAVYIAHHLIEPADAERTWRPSYRGRVETAWRHAFQLALALAFTGVLFGVLQLGAAMFGLIRISLPQRLLREIWFTFPVFGAAFAAAVHLTDVRPGLVRGVRTVGLALLAWLLPVLGALTLAFLVALIFTGLGPLWATGRASYILISAAAALVVLINAAYQEGDAPPAKVLRWSARGAAVLLTPLGLLSIVSVSLRVSQYGLTPQRIVSFAILAVGAIYAAGYAWAAIDRRTWMRRIEDVNVVGALAGVVAIVLLLSPVVDPARLASADQVRRLEGGRIAPDKFDYGFLRFRAGRFGREALDRLASARAPYAELAKTARAATSPDYRNPRLVEVPLSHATIYPQPSALPDSFRQAAPNFIGRPECLRGSQSCTIRMLDLDDDKAPEVLVGLGDSIWVFKQTKSGWVRVGDYGGVGCAAEQALKTEGGITLARPALPDLVVKGMALPFRADLDLSCKRGAEQMPGQAKGYSDEAVRVDLIKPGR